MSETAIFGAGCFWGVEAAFRRVDGVTETSVGYAGGETANPTYQEVCSGRTGHAEVVRVTFDPARVSYAALLDLFWEVHDPSQVDRQGPDVGTQYRSVVFYASEAQNEAAEASKAALIAAGRPIATQIEPAPDYWIAEDYHQQYIEKNRRIHSGLFGS
jgi:peptide-methionine (S)-S-oxide reductase